MMARIARSAGIGLLVLGLSVPALAGPGGPGPGPRADFPHHRGPDWGPSPGGHGLPSFARELWIGSMLYFVAAGSYYLWNANTQRYETVAPPPSVQGNSWAVGQSGFDPATATRPIGSEATERYRRAIGACLNGRGYSTN